MSKEKRRPRGYLQEPKNLIYDYKQRDKENKALNPYDLEKDDQSLYSAIMREFDSFDDFLIEAGYDPASIRKQQRWSFKKIKKELDKMYINDIPFSYTENGQKNDLYRNVIRALVYYFDSVKQGLKEFNYTKLKGKLEKLCVKCKKEILDHDYKSKICENCKIEK